MFLPVFNRDPIGIKSLYSHTETHAYLWGVFIHVLCVFGYSNIDVLGEWGAYTHTHTHTDTHRHAQTHTDTHRHTQYVCV